MARCIATFNADTDLPLPAPPPSRNFLEFKQVDGQALGGSPHRTKKFHAHPTIQFLVAFGDWTPCGYGNSQYGGALVDGWKLYEAASLFSEAAERAEQTAPPNAKTLIAADSVGR